MPVVKDPLLRCRGLSVEVPDLKQLRCLAAQEALLPCPRVLARAIATLYHVDPQQAGLEYAARQCRGLLFAAIAQGFGGPAVLRLITASIHVGLQIGEHPASCDHPDSLLRLALEGFGRLHKGLRLPYQFDQWQQDNLLAHIVWATLYERGAAAAADLCVAWVCTFMMVTEAYIPDCWLAVYTLPRTAVCKAPELQMIGTATCLG